MLTATASVPDAQAQPGIASGRPVSTPTHLRHFLRILHVHMKNPTTGDFGSKDYCELPLQAFYTKPTGYGRWIFIPFTAFTDASRLLS
jgi:hypothetical protein